MRRISGLKTTTLTIRMDPAVKTLLGDISARSGKYRSLGAFMVEGAYRLAEHEAVAENAAGARVGSGGGDKVLAWTFADVDAAHDLANQMRKIGINFNQLVRSRNVLSREVRKAGPEMERVLKDGLPDLEREEEMMNRLYKAIAEFEGFIGKLNARMPPAGKEEG